VCSTPNPHAPIIPVMNQQPIFASGNGMPDGIVSGGMNNMMSNIMGGSAGVSEPFDLNNFLSEIKTIVIPTLEEKLLEAKMEGTEGKIDQGGKIGEVSFKLGEISMKVVKIPRDDVQIKVIVGGVELVSTNIEIALNPFAWSYEKHAFPKISSGGEATCQISGGSLRMRLNITVDPNGTPSLEVTKSEVIIEKLDITLSKTKLKLLYKLLLSALKSTLKGMLEQQLSQFAQQAVEDNIQGLIKELL